MAVLNGERMHDTMERLLPGARSAALLWQGAAVLGGAALGAFYTQIWKKKEGNVLEL